MRSLFVIASSAAALMLLSLPAQAASFNCAKARTATEKAICANAKLNEADVKLANTYNILLQFARADYGVYDVQDAQQAWLKQRDQCGSRVACIKEEYEFRQVQLENQLRRYR